MMWQALPIVLFGIPFFGFAVFWTCMAIWMTWSAPASSQGSGGNTTPAAFKYFFPLFGVPFLLIGAGMLSAPFWVRRKASRTVYALTDRRAIVVAGTIRGGRQIRSYGPEDMRDMHRTERADGSGDLVFYETTRTVRGKHGTRQVTQPHGFLCVAAVAELERVVRETLAIED